MTEIRDTRDMFGIDHASADAIIRKVQSIHDSSEDHFGFVDKSVEYIKTLDGTEAIYATFVFSSIQTREQVLDKILRGAL